MPPVKRRCWKNVEFVNMLGAVELCTYRPQVVFLPCTTPPHLPSRAAQLGEAETKTREVEAQKDSATLALASATASESQQGELVAAEAAAHADELRQKLDEAGAAAAAAAAEAEAAAERTIRDLQENVGGLEGKLKEVEERVLAGVEGAGARAEEEEAQARDLRKALEESVAERTQVCTTTLFDHYCLLWICKVCLVLLVVLIESVGVKEGCVHLWGETMCLGRVCVRGVVFSHGVASRERHVSSDPPLSRPRV